MLDASQSMYGLWHKQQKIAVAQRMLSHWADSLQTLGNIQMALRVYGDQYPVPPQVCEDSRLLVPFGSANAKAIKKALHTLQPKGTTPIAYALQQAVNDFPALDGSQHLIVLITDGIEECAGDPCQVSRQLQQKGISMRPIVVGLGTKEQSTLECIGRFLPAENTDDLPHAFDIIVNSMLHETTAQINLLDEQSKPTTTNVGVHLYAYDEAKPQPAFVHTLNAYGLPDTLRLDASLTYKIVVHTLPPLVKDSVRLKAATHNHIGIEAPVGSLSITFGKGQQVDYSIPVLIQSVPEAKRVNVQYVGQSQDYIADYYAVDILSLPPVYMDSVKIQAKHTTQIQLPVPGILNIQKQGFTHGSIYRKQHGEWEEVYHLRNLVNYVESLYLLPGNYKVLYRNKAAYSHEDSKSLHFKIESKKTTHISL